MEEIFMDELLNSSNVAFEEWKDKVEEEQVCNYVRNAAPRGGIEYYQCNRGGFYAPKGNGKRRVKSQGTVIYIHA